MPNVTSCIGPTAHTIDLAAHLSRRHAAISVDAMGAITIKHMSPTEGTRTQVLRAPDFTEIVTADFAVPLEVCCEDVVIFTNTKAGAPAAVWAVAKDGCAPRVLPADVVFDTVDGRLCVRATTAPPKDVIAELREVGFETGDWASHGRATLSAARLAEAPYGGRPQRAFVAACKLMNLIAPEYSAVRSILVAGATLLMTSADVCTRDTPALCRHGRRHEWRVDAGSRKHSRDSDDEDSGGSHGPPKRFRANVPAAAKVDWICPVETCKFFNYWHRHECMKCQQDRPADYAKSGMRGMCRDHQRPHGCRRGRSCPYRH